MIKCKKYAVAKQEALGHRAGVAFKVMRKRSEEVSDCVIKAIKFPKDIVKRADFKIYNKDWEYYDTAEEAVRSLDEWVNADAKCTVFKLEKAISKKRLGFVHCGDVYSYSHLIADYLNKIGEEPTVLRRDYVNIKDIEEYNSKEEAEISLNSFLNGNEPESF